MSEKTALSSAASGAADNGSGPILLRFLRLAGPYFTSDEKWWARLLTAGVLALTLLQIAIQVRLNLWNKDFFDALETHNWTGFLHQMGIFALLALGSMGTAVYQVYLKQLLQLRWRRWLTTRLTKRWLENGRHYQLNFVADGVENPDQRITENVRGATEMAVEFALGILNAALTLLSFVGILWILSGVLPVSIGDITIDIPGYMVGAALVYAAIGSTLTYIVGKPIVRANIHQNRAEADFRFALVRLRENSEGIALIGGEADEEAVLTRHFAQVMTAVIELMRTQRNLMWMTSGYAMIGMVYPTLVASPRYFAGVITLGGLMQITAAFGQVQTGLTWFVDNFPRIAEWRSHVLRLFEFDDLLHTTIEATTEAGEVTRINLVEEPWEAGMESLTFHDLQNTLADGNVVIAETNATIARGEKVLIMGESGSGKSMLLRAIAGLWPWGAGTILVPQRSKLMFMPQKPYLPLGSLRAAIAYPASPRRFRRRAIEAALKRCMLEHLIPRLNETERWDHILSVGEQQRVAFARLLLHQPDWVFMDEATAALDEEGQAAMMTIFKNELPWTTVVSVGHRPGLEAFHDRTLRLVKSESGAHLVTRRGGGAHAARPRVKLHHRLTRAFAARKRRAKNAA